MTTSWESVIKVGKSLNVDVSELELMNNIIDGDLQNKLEIPDSDKNDFSNWFARCYEEPERELIFTTTVRRIANALIQKNHPKAD